MTRLCNLHRRHGISFLGGLLFTLNGAIAQDGTLDNTFSDDGQYGFMPGIPDVFTFEILETDGKIFAVLSGMNGGTSSYLMRLNENGSPDGDFGTAGILEMDSIGLTDAALSPDGTRIILLKGSAEGFHIGAMDLNGGWVQPWTAVNAPGGGGFAKMLVDAAGRIYIGKGTYIDGETYGQVIRLLEDFSLDASFGTNGTAYAPDGPFCYPIMEIDNLGRVVLGSYQPACAGIWRFNTDGTHDASFSYTLDLTPYSLENWLLDFAIAHDNSIYLQPNTWGWPAYLFKLSEDGSLDMGFGTGGYMDLSDADPNYYSAPDELLIEPNGGLIVLAQTYGADGYMSAKHLTRLDEHGVIDPEFDPGVQPIDDQGYNLRIHFHCATLQDDGKVLSMDQVVKWQNGELHGYAPLITRFHNSKGAFTAVTEAGPWVDDVVVFPNPTDGPVTLLAPEQVTWRNTMAVITNSMGAVVMQERLVNEHIDLSALAPGVYFCVVRYEEGTRHARIVKE